MAASAVRPFAARNGSMSILTPSATYLPRSYFSRRAQCFNAQACANMTYW